MTLGAGRERQRGDGEEDDGEEEDSEESDSAGAASDDAPGSLRTVSLRPPRYSGVAGQTGLPSSRLGRCADGRDTSCSACAGSGRGSVRAGAEAALPASQPQLTGQQVMVKVPDGAVAGTQFAVQL